MTGQGSDDIKIEKTEDIYYGATYRQNKTQSRFRDNRRTYTRRFADGNRRLNPLDRNGEPSRCAICGSVFHWAKSCSDTRQGQENKTKQAPDEVQVTLIEECMTNLVGETLSMAILDSGCTKTVCGEEWLQCYLNTLNDRELKSVIERKSATIFKFGSGKHVTSVKNVTLPTIIAGRSVMLSTDVVQIPLPLLLSKEAMKKANTRIDFANDKIIIFNTDIPVSFSSCGHYCIPIGRVGNFKEGDITEEALAICNVLQQKTPLQKKAAAVKLHRQFSHPNSSRLKQLIDANNNDVEIFNHLDELEHSCQICLKYKKLKPTPIVGFQWQDDSMKQ